MPASRRTRQSQQFDGPTPGQLAADARNRRGLEDARRALCTGFLFWTECAHRPCRRQKACVGEVNACLARWWPFVPDKLKVWFRANVKARAAGMDVEAACRAADAEVERQAEYIAQADAAWEAEHGRAGHRRRQNQQGK